MKTYDQPNGTKNGMKNATAKWMCCVIAQIVLAAGCSPSGSFKITAVPTDQTLKERIVFRESGWVSDRIALIDISGILINATEEKLFADGEHIVSLVVEQLDAAAADPRVKAVVLRINSPGGTVTASDILYEEILAFKARTGKPVIAYFQDVAASGAYYLACAADEIIAQRTTVTGSIGVILLMVNMSGTLDFLRIETDAITSGPFKDSGSPFRKMRKAERDVFQSLVDGFYEQFVTVVEAGRGNLTREEVLTLADGRVYNAEQALSAGLIDRIGTLRLAIRAAKNRASIERAHTVIYHRPLAWKPNIYASSPAQTAANISLLHVDFAKSWTSGPEFMYIWNIGR
ncbi:MAG: signal peptide peptidase SppA [Planctomycetota bacterium]